MDMMNPTMVEDTSSEVQRRLSELGLESYSSAELMSYTSNFLESNKIGSGGYGKVYRGEHPIKGIPIAVKLLENMDIVEDTFMAEVCTMGKARHRNLIKLYGYCFESNMKALVYEYMENGSLEKILYESNPDASSIEWVTLYGIANDIANGLNYLHDGLEEKIIHYDIKAANVLLGKKFGEKFLAKLTDFGLAKIMKRDVSKVDVSRIRGTFGYIAPEIYMAGTGSQASCKCDVYSFGMLLFEILGRRRNGVVENWFPGIVWKQFKSGKLEQLIRDFGIKGKDIQKAIVLSKLALCCAHHIPEQRPSMKEVVMMLDEISPVKEPSDNPFPLAQFSHSSMVPSKERFLQVSLKAPPARSERKWADSSLEQHPGVNNEPGGYGGDSLPQLREEDLAIFVPNKRRITKLVGKTALKYSEMILNWISNDEAGIFCINGMGGVGKTTILDDVYNQLIAKDLKQKIIWVSVSKDDNFIKLLQKDLAEELEIKLRSDDVLKRARELSQALEKRKKVVLFLDDIWKEISLDEIGIPEPTLENGCKLLFTTRKLDMSRRMRCHKTITVKPLLEDEAWDLFMKKVNYVLTPEVRKVAEMVAKKCSGLPLAIITVGKAMSDENYSDIGYWTGALNELNLKDPSNETMDMEMENVYKCLKFSYDRLGNDIQRECFLCCALYPESWEIVKRNLLEFWIMDGIVVGENRQDELFKGRCILDKLKDHCLLETVDEVCDVEYDEMSDGVKMHDLIRDMALRLKKKCFMVKDGPSLKELPNEEEWVDLEKTSFMTNEIEAISISPKCMYLSTVILKGTFLKSVSHNFFVHMKCLKVLDLRCDPDLKNVDLKLLPDSISDLVNLCVLRLSWYTMLKKLPSLAKLVLLRTLECNNTGFEELPEGMERLVKLRCLNLHGVQLKKRIPFGLISKLSGLQELYLGGIKWDKLYEVGKGESFAEELLSLKKLENLSVSFHCLSDYASYVRSPKFKVLTCFFLAVGGLIYEGSYLGRPPHATVQICCPADKHIAPFFPQNTKRVEAESFQDVIRLNELGWLIKDVKELVAFSVYCCDKMECMWSSKQNEELCATGTSSICWLQSLDKIEIGECTKLYTLFEGIPISSVVFCLKELYIVNCNNLKNVFPSSRLLQLLPKLETIAVDGCGEIEELIGDDEENRNTETPIAIPSLKRLGICDLPKLKKIYRGVMICDSLESICVDICLELKRLPQLKGEDNSTPPSALKQIKGSRKWWDSLEWDPDYPQNILQPFFIEYLEEEEDLNSQSDGQDSQSVGEDSQSDRKDSLMLEGVVASGFRHNKFGIIRTSMSENDCCHFSSDGKLITSGGHDNKTIWRCYNCKIGRCDNCKMFPTVGKRYKCKTCYDEISGGFDLCEECYNTPPFKHADLVHQHQRKRHTFELIADGFILEEVGVIRASMSEVGCCHFSSDGKLIASGGHDNKVVLWHTDSLKLKTTLEEHSMPITDIRFSPSLPRIATSSFDKTVRVWDVDNPDYSLRTFTGHSASVMSLDFHPNKEDLICSCDSDSEIRYWSINNGSCVSVFKGGPTQVRFQPCLGRYLAVDETQIYRYEGHTKAIRSVCWHPSGELLASVTEDSVRIWALTPGLEGMCVRELIRYYDDKYHSCVFHPTYPYLLLIGYYQHLIAWDTVQNKILWYEAAHDGLIASLAVSNVTGLVASASHDKFVKLWKGFFFPCQALCP